MNGTSFDDATRALRGTRRGLATAATLGAAGLLGGLAGPSGARAGKRKPAAKCAGPLANELGQGGFFRQAQLFTASRSGSLRQIKLNVKKAVGSAGDYSVQLLRVVSDAPSHSPLDVLAATTVPNASVPNGNAPLIAKFASTRLEAGTDYAIAVSRPEGVTYTVVVTADDRCQDTRHFFAEGTGPFVELDDGFRLIATVLVD